MLIRRIAPNEQAALDAAWRKERQRRIRELRRAREKEQAIKGIDFEMRRADGRRMEFRGRKYGVPPVPWPLVLRTVDVQEKFEQFTEQARRHRENPEAPPPQVQHWTAVYAEVADIFKALCYPIGRLRRLLWPITPNPMRHATPAEVGLVLGFFSACHRQDVIETLIREVSRLGTSPSKSDASLPASQPGPTNGATPSRGRRS